MVNNTLQNLQYFIYFRKYMLQSARKRLQESLYSSKHFPGFLRIGCNLMNSFSKQLKTFKSNHVYFRKETIKSKRERIF